MRATVAKTWKTWLWRTLLALAFWVLLVGGERGDILFGALVAAAAAALSCRVAPPSGLRLRPLALAGFVPFFVWRSLAGGVDVARRAFQSTPSLAPRFIPYRMERLAPGPPRLLFVLTVSLFPGTLGARLVKDRLWVHCLDARGGVEDDLDAVERRVAALFRAPENAE